MASGLVPSADGGEVYRYASGQPFTHGGDGANTTWAANTGIRRLRVRRGRCTDDASGHSGTYARATLDICK